MPKGAEQVQQGVEAKAPGTISRPVRRMSPYQHPAPAPARAMNRNTRHWPMGGVQQSLEQPRQKPIPWRGACARRIPGPRCAPGSPIALPPVEFGHIELVPHQGHGPRGGVEHDHLFVKAVYILHAGDHRPAALVQGQAVGPGPGLRDAVLSSALPPILRVSLQAIPLGREKMRHCSRRGGVLQ